MARGGVTTVVLGCGKEDSIFSRMSLEPFSALGLLLPWVLTPLYLVWLMLQLSVPLCSAEPLRSRATLRIPPKKHGVEGTEDSRANPSCIGSAGDRKKGVPCLKPGWVSVPSDLIQYPFIICIISTLGHSSWWDKRMFPLPSSCFLLVGWG